MINQPTDNLSHSDSRLEQFCLAGLITGAFLAVPMELCRITWRLFPESMQTQSLLNWYYYLLALAFGLILTMGSWKRSGICLGKIRHHWWKVLLVCGLPVLLTAIIYPRLPERPFAGAPMGMWLISPLAQDLVFLGYLYGRFERSLSGVVHRRLPIRWVLVVVAIYFALYHLPNLLAMSLGYVVFQLCYTFLGSLLVGLSRQWTGSIIYVTLTHMAVNYITWATG